jgi:hypothetical protein
MEYDVICDENLGNLIYWVNKRLDEGWSLLGGVATSETGGYYQAITKPNVVENPDDVQRALDPDFKEYSEGYTELGEVPGF